jgi:hypothetical protein
MPGHATAGWVLRVGAHHGEPDGATADGGVIAVGDAEEMNFKHPAAFLLTVFELGSDRYRHFILPIASTSTARQHPHP